ncbi:peptidylprolyl isomerase [Ponticaulis koreensis]|uniref:peptidylprolyl isomerase n=1 Tax=Ponticaulis koreensis TaxID=1123045 RepID=UPI0003B5A4F8|nr:peptidylprolyl isomerase [Ponticaulis koreensis]
MQRTIFAALFGSLLLTTAACEQNSSEPTGVPIRVSAAVAAVVNGEPIYATDVELEAVAQGRVDVGTRLETTDPVFADILKQLIDQKLLAQEALARGLHLEENAQHRLQAARERILGNILIENLVSAEVDDAAILEMYEAQTALQQLGEEVLIRHILVETEEEADELYQELRGGAEFAEVAFTHSIDRSSSAEGGLLGYFLPEEFSAPFPSIINRTAVGAISSPFESDLGWHIIKIDDRRTEAPPTFDETRPMIVEFLTLSEISSVLERLHNRASIETVIEDPEIGVRNFSDAPESLDDLMVEDEFPSGLPLADESETTDDTAPTTEATE